MLQAKVRTAESDFAVFVSEGLAGAMVLPTYRHKLLRFEIIHSVAKDSSIH